MKVNERIPCLLKGACGDRDASDFPIGRPETEKLLNCNLLWQVICRHVQMILLIFPP